MNTYTILNIQICIRFGYDVLNINVYKLLYGRYVANVIIGTLEIDSQDKIFLLNSEVLEKANYATISRLFDMSLLILWPEGIGTRIFCYFYRMPHRIW